MAIDLQRVSDVSTAPGELPATMAALSDGSLSALCHTVTYDGGGG